MKRANGTINRWHIRVSLALLLLLLFGAMPPLVAGASTAADTLDIANASLADSRSLTADTYVLNNPLKYTDPSGHFIPLLVPILVGMAMSGAMYGGEVLLTERDWSWAEFGIQAAIGGAFGGIGAEITVASRLAMVGKPLGQGLFGGFTGGGVGTLEGAMMRAMGISDDAIGLTGRVTLPPNYMSSGLSRTEVTTTGIQRIERYLTTARGIAAKSDPMNTAMIQRLRSGLRTPWDLRFYQHEMAESRMYQGLRLTRIRPSFAQRVAHNTVSRWQGLDPLGTQDWLIHPDVFR